MLRSAAFRAARGAFNAVPRRYMAEEAASNRNPNKLLLNFLVPSASILKEAEVDMIMVPASNGQMGILPQHVPTVAQLQPGLVQIHDGDKIDKFFVSSGYAFVHKDRTDVCAAEAVKLEDVDMDAVKQNLAECQANMSSAQTEAEKASAQIGVQLYTVLEAVMK
mmetsp:Transcript_12518/g.38223  ORF Transcript_12518/g.38223 Transcript_12518/m.38223 type:complete len:164 (-) Transcript_12518:229-720(-)|eukprot:CAMPEP_0198723304 /NCGR_PEP_ID=MMETSP1475-20131203/834_1 /TAXON_ID= ORGANISM="Unidentified sp., Strain CCMP1999" /NCGR_SAMPLE_ID=MMETSP1475 /ASSEMBLY_ACC=CAM_ASM_001111 /LENGTH=163 /DNA_ID=CAMNT_0044484385 /DNA_START=154 /DNA_END=645 /DNA_ORIENTATION=-